MKHVILAVLAVPSITAALITWEEMAKSLIKTENEEDLVQTFKKFESEQGHNTLSLVLAEVTQVPEHIPKVATCLRAAVDPFPTEMLNVCGLVHFTLFRISNNTDTESFANVIVSFKPSDVKPLTSIRYWTLQRSDAVKVLESAMAKSPELITSDLPRWIAFHGFDQNSDGYTGFRVVHEQAFRYLTSFATEDVLTDALSIVAENEHFRVDSSVQCCYPHNPLPQDLSNKLGDLLERLKTRKALIKAVLQSLLPSVLVDLVLGHVLVEYPDISIPSPDIFDNISSFFSIPN